MLAARRPALANRFLGAGRRRGGHPPWLRGLSLGFHGYPHLIALGNPLPFLFGPLLYLYRGAHAADRALRPALSVHRLPFVTYVIYLLGLLPGAARRSPAGERVPGGDIRRFRIGSRDRCVVRGRVRPRDFSRSAIDGRSVSARSAHPAMAHGDGAGARRRLEHRSWLATWSTCSAVIGSSGLEQSSRCARRSSSF